ncbi:MAG: nitrate- and nitrite sensing domain-containing protein, partial [Betaproteobacteria bacterium]|nr:nitrate- and nitrite sensing domain-containing protein [Betaproteobacteria bacterium]
MEMKFRFSFNDTSVKAKLAVAIAIPAIALAFMIGQNTLDAFHEIGQLRIVQSDAELLVRTSALIHELQREGEFSQRYLGAKGAGDTAETLKMQRAETDKRYADFRTTVENIEVSKTGDGPVESLGAASKKLETLISKRGDVTEQKISQIDLLQLYNDTLGALINAEVRIRHEREQVDREVAGAARAYVTLVEAKVKAGQNLGAGIIGFEAGQFSPEAFQVFAARAAETNKLFSYLFEIASPSAKGIWEKANASKELKTMNEVIPRALQVGAGAPLWLSGEEWFRLSTARNNVLKEVEKEFASELEQTTSRR